MVPEIFDKETFDKTLPRVFQQVSNIRCLTLNQIFLLQSTINNFEIRKNPNQMKFSTNGEHRGDEFSLFRPVEFPENYFFHRLPVAGFTEEKSAAGDRSDEESDGRGVPETNWEIKLMFFGVFFALKL